MTVNGFEPSRHVSSLLKGLFRRQGQFCFISQKKLFLIGFGPPYLSRLYLSSCVIWLLQNFAPTTYRPLLPSRLLTHNSKPSKFTTNIIYLLPVPATEIYKLSLLNANSAILVCIELPYIPAYKPSLELQKKVAKLKSQLICT